MTDLDKLLRRYIERFEAGGDADPSDVLAEASASDRAELRELIAGYLEHAAPGQEWDREAFKGSLSETVAAQIEEQWATAEEELRVELVRLRNQRQITRRELVDRLADSLGVAGRREKVAFYYHRLESGWLPVQGVSARVWEALAQLLGTSADALRRAGTVVRPPSSPRTASAYARTAPQPPPEYALADSSADAGRAADAEGTAEEPDEVDRLFTGG